MGCRAITEDEMEMAAELVHELDVDGKQLRVVKLSDYSAPPSTNSNHCRTLLEP